MKKFITIVFLMLCGLSYSQTIDQQLLVVQNDGIAGGNLVIAVQVKGTNLPAGNTLGSATIDIKFDNTKLAYINATDWGFDLFQQAVNNKAFIRLAVTCGSVSPTQSTGFDIKDTYSTWVELNFNIIDPSGLQSLSIIPRSNAIGLFRNHANNPQTNVIKDYPLSDPIVIMQPLPVELTAFTSSVTGSKVDLNWNTATEVNNSGFNIERKSDKSAWKQIGFVKGSGNSTKPIDYSFKDTPVGDTKFQYRLKQINFDGKYSYSPIVEVKLVMPLKYNLEQNYPNPFNPSTIVRFELPEPAHVSIQLFNSLGQKVAVILNDNMSAGYQSVVVDGSKLASGTYVYRLEAGNYSQVKKMTLLK
jgi:hypothetical protein